MFIDKNIMPTVLQMAKTHVDSINTINAMVKSESGKKRGQHGEDLAKEIEARNKTIKELDDLVKEMDENMQTQMDENRH
jgi:hypothetical protein